MTLSGHIAVTTITIQYIPDLAILLAVNFLLHPLLDAIPHAEWTTFRDSKLKMILITLMDTVAAIWLTLLAFQNLRQPAWLIVTAIIIGLWPDLLDFVAGKRLKRFRHWHQFFHTWPIAPNDPVGWERTATGNVPTWLKVLSQSILVALAYYLIVN
ncbi:MAG: hypothetical protein WCT32_01190 [Patescibacteria group bacterium]|jgi:hypothetical protein